MLTDERLAALLAAVEAQAGDTAWYDRWGEPVDVDPRTVRDTLAELIEARGIIDKLVEKGWHAGHDNPYLSAGHYVRLTADEWGAVLALRAARRQRGEGDAVR